MTDSGDSKNVQTWSFIDSHIDDMELQGDRDKLREQTEQTTWAKERNSSIEVMEKSIAKKITEIMTKLKEKWASPYLEKNFGVKNPRKIYMPLVFKEGEGVNYYPFTINWVNFIIWIGTDHKHGQINKIWIQASKYSNVRTFAMEDNKIEIKDEEWKCIAWIEEDKLNFQDQNSAGRDSSDKDKMIKDILDIVYLLRKKTVTGFIGIARDEKKEKQREEDSRKPSTKPKKKPKTFFEENNREK